MYKVFIVIQLFAIARAVGQSYHFPLSMPDDKLGVRYDARMDSGRVACLFQPSGKYVKPSIYRKVFLGEDLRPIDSVDFVVPGRAWLVAVESNDRYTIHVFYSSHNPLFVSNKYFYQFIFT